MSFLQCIRVPRVLRNRFVVLRPERRSLWRLFLAPPLHAPFSVRFRILSPEGTEQYGSVYVCWHTDRMHQAELSVDLMPERQGQGVGFQALALMESFLARSMGVELCTARVQPDNQRSLSLCLKAGYTVTDRSADGVVSLEKRVVV